MCDIFFIYFLNSGYWFHWVILLCCRCLGQSLSTSDFGDTLPQIILVQSHRQEPPLPWTIAKIMHKHKAASELQSATTNPRLPAHRFFSLVEMWCTRMALRRLQRIAITPLNISGGLTSNMQREMSTLPRVYVTRQIPPEGLKILRQSGQWVMVWNLLFFKCDQLLTTAHLKRTSIECLLWKVNHLFRVNRAAKIYPEVEQIRLKKCPKRYSPKLEWRKCTSMHRLIYFICQKEIEFHWEILCV